MDRRRHVCAIVALTISLICFSVSARCQEPLRVTACELKENPEKFDHRLVEVTGFISHGFEDFGLFDPSCPSWPYVWLEYGGTKKSGTMYCCGVSADRTRDRELVVEEIAVPLTADDKFETLDKIVQTERDTVLHASLVGRFFAGKETRFPNGEREWGGYGHMGCCSLLAIQQVISVAPHDRDELDYRSSPDQPELGKAGCGFQDLVRPWPYQDWVKAQQAADARYDSVAFDRPAEVAAAALIQLAKLDVSTPTHLEETKKSRGRIIFEMRTGDEAVRYMIVLGKPYMLTFYARDPRKIAWVVIGAYKTFCDEADPVSKTRKRSKSN